MTEATIFTALPKLETSRLILRPFVIEDVSDVFGYASDPMVSRFTTWSSPKVLADSKLLIETLIERALKNEPVPWGIVSKETQRLIGATGFDAWDEKHSRGEFGYSLSRQYWGRGLATEAANMVVQFGFDVMGLHRIEAKCMVENVASERVMQKLGLTWEGVLRGYWLKDGTYRDVKLYSILR